MIGGDLGGGVGGSDFDADEFTGIGVWHGDSSPEHCGDTMYSTPECRN